MSTVPGSRGFSFVELLLVLFLIGVLASSSQLVLRQFRDHRIVAKTAKEVRAFIDLGGKMALALNRDIEVRYESGANQLIMRDIGAASGSTPRLRRVEPLPSRVTVIRAQFGNVTGNFGVLRLRRNGSATPGRFVLLGENGDRCDVIQALRGMRRVECNS